MSMIQFCTYVGNHCGGADCNELDTFTDDRLMRESIGDTELQHLNGMINCALNPQGLPVAPWNADQSAGTINGTHVSVKATLENKLAAVRAALMYALPALPPDAITRVIMAFAARYMCSEPGQLMQYLTKISGNRTIPAWVITEDDRPVSLALMKLGLLPAPHLLDIDRLTNYVALSDLGVHQASAFSARAVIEFIITAMRYADDTLCPNSTEVMPPDVILLSIVGAIRSRKEGVAKQIHAATQSFIREVYTDATTDQLDAFAEACVQKYISRMVHLRNLL